jgi:hypothetical protein
MKNDANDSAAVPAATRIGWCERTDPTILNGASGRVWIACAGPRRGGKPMKTRIVLIISAVLVLSVLVAGGLASRSQPSEAERLVNQILSSERPPDPELIRQLGARALPPLIKALSIDHPTLERGYDNISSVLPDFISSRLPQVFSAEGRRLNAIVWVGLLGPAAKPAVPKLIKLLKDDILDVNAAKSLAMIGPAAQEAIPALTVALQERRPFAATALGSIGTPKTVGPILEAVCQHGPAGQREEARLALTKLHARFPG